MRVDTETGKYLGRANEALESASSATRAKHVLCWPRYHSIALASHLEY